MKISLAQVLVIADRFSKSEEKVLKLRNVSAVIKRQLQIARLTK